MKNLFYSAIFVFAIGCSPTKNSVENNQAKPNNNTVESTSAVLWQQTAAEYTALCYQAFNFAAIQLEQNLLQSKKKGNKPAIILDLDETVLDNSPYNGKLLAEDATYSPNTWKEWTKLSNAQLVPGALDFLKFARSAGVEVFFISNRTVEELEVTIGNLKEVGAPVNANNVFLKTHTSNKTERRGRVMGQFNILMLIGDNLADFHDEFEGDLTIAERKEKVKQFKNEFGTRFIILPNVMYGGWDKAIRNPNNDASIRNSEAEGKLKLIQTY